MALDHLRQKITEEVNKIPKKSPDHTKLSLTKSHIDSLESEIYFLKEEIRQKNLLITSLISLRSTREPVDQLCGLNNVRKTTDDEKHDEQKKSRLLINCENKVNETLDNKDHENNVCINPPLLIKNRISHIPDITDKKASTNRNTSTKTSNQRENSITEKSKKLAFIIGDSMIKDVDGYLLTGSLNRKYIVKIRLFSSAKTSDMEYYITPTKRDFDPGIYILHVGTNDLTLNDTPEEITEHIVNIATFLKTENNTDVISNIVPRGDSKKEKAEAVNKLLVDICEQREIPLIDHGNISIKRHLNKSKQHLNAHGKSGFVKNLSNF